jgi:hypothetical protein
MPLLSLRGLSVSGMYVCFFIKKNLSFPYPYLSGVGTTCFSSYCDKDSAIIFTTGRLLDINILETEVGANDCKCSRGVLNVPFEAR